MGSARTMTYSRADVLKALVPRLSPQRGPKRRYALVLSANAYNDSHDHGVLVAISTGIPTEPLVGVHVIADWKSLGLDRPSVVTPWLWTLEWDAVIEKVGQMSPHEFGQVIERLREVVSI